MNTIKDLAIKWWEYLSNREKAKLTFYFDAGRRWEELFEVEIEKIFYNKVIKLWWDNLEPEICTLLILKYFPNSSSIFDTGIKEIYLKEHTKEQPLKGDVLEEELWNTPQSVDNTIDMEETDVWDEIYKHFPITWETPAVQQIINHIKQHYSLIKK